MQRKHSGGWILNMVSDKYEVILSAKAYDDLDKIYEDVLSVSKDIDTAEKYLSSIKERILGLEDNPHNHPIRKYGRYADKGYRQTDVKKYTIVFKINEESLEVLVITICLTSSNV